MNCQRSRLSGLFSSAAALATLCFALAPSAAHACGGCFSPVVPSAPGVPPNPQAVLQDAERVIFLRDETTKTSTVWVEVRYTGLASEFGWVLPLPKQPVVSVGTAAGLDRLDATTSVQFKVKVSSPENCRDPWDGCTFKNQSADAGGNGPDGFTSNDTMAGGGGGSLGGVEILDQGQAGPYDYTVIQGKDGAVLQTWLDTRGYKTPTSAVPILQSHADKGDVFVAIKLSSGNGVNLIRPVVLTMQDAEPCVPLRLTSIAASDEVNVVVTIAGQGRAIPKNMLHVEPNLAKLNWNASNGQVANNYEQVLSAAIDEAAGRAFFTESAMPGSKAIATLPKEAKLTTAWAADAKNLHDLAVGLYNADPQGSATPWLHADTASVFEKVGIVEPIFLTFGNKGAAAALGQLWVCGSIWSGAVFSPTGNDTCIPAGESFFSPSVSYTATEAKAVVVDGAKLASALQEQIAAPLLTLLQQLQAAPVVTRLVMRIGPQEMDRDPVFAFNAALPLVSPIRTAQTNPVCTSGWLPALHQRIVIPGVGSYIFPYGIQSTAIDPRFLSAPFAARIEALDETGAPTLVGTKQVELVDTALLGAIVGKPSPVAALALTSTTPWLAPASDLPATTLLPWPMPPGCTAKSGWVDGKLPPGTPVDPDAGATDVADSDAGSSDDDTVASDVSAASDTAAANDGGSGDDSTLTNTATLVDVGATDTGTPAIGTTPRGSSSGCSAATPTSRAPLGWLSIAALAALLLVSKRRRLA